MSSAEELINYKRELLVEQIARLEAEDSLYQFTKQAWHVLEPATDFVDGWHIKAICDHLEAVYYGKIRRLIINVPPRTCKSTITSVIWPAWMFIKNPSKRILCAANSHTLASRDSLKCRDLILSEWYQSRWGDRVKLIRQGVEKFETSGTGFRQCTSVGSKVVGKGGGILIADDLNDTTEALSDLVRNGTNNWYSTSFSNRFDDIKTGGLVIMMQRCHEDDITGYILKSPSSKYFTHLMLPMRFEKKRKCVTVPLPGTNGKPWEDPRTEEGQLLWPERFGEEECILREFDLRTAYNIAGQEQQRPAPEEGGLLKAPWFSRWMKPEPPKNLIKVIQSWDTALETSQMNDFSVCTTWGIFHDDDGIPQMILLSLFRERLEAPDLRRMAQRLYKDYRDTGEFTKEQLEVGQGKHVPDMVLIERKASGHGLLQELRRAGVMVFEYEPEKDKVLRVKLISSYIECGRIWLPFRPPHYEDARQFAQKLIDECTVFPYGAHDDIVDSMTQAISRVRDSGLLRVKDDPIHIQQKRKAIDFYGARSAD